MDLLTNLRAHLVAEGLARVPSVAGAAAPLWVEPRTGVPAPGEGANATERGSSMVLGVYQTGGVAPKPYESWLRSDIVDLWFRSTSPAATFALEGQMRDAVIDKRAWQMGALHILESQLWRPLARVESNAQAYTHSLGFVFFRYA